MTVSVSCQCGQLLGELDTNLAGQHNRLRCYCRDCQAFAHYLGTADEVLDGSGGTDIIQVSAAALTITRGKEHLACVRLTDKGLHRWYAKCCNTPIGNTPGLSMPFIGLIHSCLTPAEEITPTFGPIRMNVFVSSANGDPKPKAFGFIGGILRMLWIILVGRIRGDARSHPFFDPITGKPVVAPAIARTQ